MTDKDRKQYGIKSPNKAPDCDNHIILYCWHLIEELLFVAYFKRSSLNKAASFLTTFSKTSGPVKKKLPTYKFESLIRVEHSGNYAIPVISNTRKEADYGKLKPVVDWFNEREDQFVRNLSLVLEEMKLKDIEDMKFPSDESGGK
jgi:hypothetical protein